MTQTQLGGGSQVNAQVLYSTSADQLHTLGERTYSNDGRAFRYVKAGGTSLVSGKLQQASAEVTANQNLTAVAAAIGDFAIVSTSTVTITANQYAGGYALITTGTGLGYAYSVSGHAAFTAAAPTLQLRDAIQVALTTSSRIDLVANPYTAVIVNPAVASSAPIGVGVYPITNAQFGWVLTAGPAICLQDGTGTVGTTQVASNAVAGAVEPFTGVQAVVGVSLTGVADQEYGAIMVLEH